MQARMSLRLGLGNLSLRWRNEEVDGECNIEHRLARIAAEM